MVSDMGGVPLYSELIARAWNNGFACADLQTQRVGINVLYAEKDPYTIRVFLCKPIPILYGSFLCTTIVCLLVYEVSHIAIIIYVATKPLVHTGPSYILEISFTNGGTESGSSGSSWQ